jgi:hypothetical protein
MKIVSMEKKEDRIFDPWILIKIFRQDDKEPFLFPQRFREKGLGSNQVLKPLGGLGREKIRKLAIFGATRMMSADDPKEPHEEKKATNPCRKETVPLFNSHENQYIFK